MVQRSLIAKFLYLLRNLRYREIFKSLTQYCYGDILDVGGGDFYIIARKKKLNFKTWTTLGPLGNNIVSIKDERYIAIQGDGCNMKFKDNHFDTVVNINVLEHVFLPIKMVNEIARVLKPKGYGIFLIPQTSVIHMAPYHYYNFTRFWIIEAMKRAGLEILEIKPLGGIWSSMASHLFLFFFQSIRFEEMSSMECKRNILFYLLYPAMFLYAIMSIPICMLLSLGDLTEEPNNHLVVVTKR